MNKEVDNKLDELTGKLMKEVSVENPPIDFTAKIMSRVEVVSKSRIKEHKPLISKRAWFVLGVLAIGIFSALFFGKVQMENSWLTTKALDLVPNIDSLVFPDYKASNIFLYGIVGFALFSCVQVFMLKDYFNRRLTMH